jgi:urea transport system permease protein
VTSKRCAAIESFAGDIGLDVRAALNPLICDAQWKSPMRLNPEGPATSRGAEPGSRRH